MLQYMIDFLVDYILRDDIQFKSYLEFKGYANNKEKHKIKYERYTFLSACFSA